jgi:Fic family protein
MFMGGLQPSGMGSIALADLPSIAHREIIHGKFRPLGCTSDMEIYNSISCRRRKEDSMPFDPAVPYDDLPPLPPKTELETKAVLKQALRATRALAELKGAGGLIPDQAILINAIPLQEARISSEIENIVTTQDELFRGAGDESTVTDPQTKEVLRYRTALRQGYEDVLQQAISLKMILAVCSTLRNEAVEFRRADEQVVIGNRATSRVTYTPPRGGRALMRKLRNLEAYLLNEEGPDPLIRMAVAHY